NERVFNEYWRDRIYDRYIKWKNKTKNERIQIQNCQNERALDEFWRNRLYNRYKKWKNKTKDEHQIILNLRAQILLLQNNLYNMAEARRLPTLKYVST
ncbi:4035_t:CDS:1, partial [Gigaspora margarita]